MNFDSVVHNGQVVLDLGGSLPEGTAVRVLVTPANVDERTAEPSDVEFERLLDELAAGPPGQLLPADFSRADIYADHD